MSIIDKVKTTLQCNKAIKWIELNKIHVDTEFKSIFPQKESDVQKIAESLKNGFDTAFPIILTKGVQDVPDGTIVDGHSRLEACRLAKVNRLAYIEKSFANREAIIEFIYRTQMSRRNLTEQEQFAYYQKMAAIKKDNGKQIKTEQQIADDLEISRRQVSKFKEVEKKANPDTLESFKAGKISLNAAYKQMKLNEVADGSKKIGAVSKPLKKTYADGYAAGVRYAIQEITKGRIAEELLSELSKESHEQKQAE